MHDVLFLQGITLAQGQVAAGTAVTLGQVTYVVDGREERIGAGRRELVADGRAEIIDRMKA